VIEPRGIKFAKVGALLWWGSLKEGGHGEHIGVDEIKRLN